MASGALMLSIDLEFKQPAQNLLEDVITVFRNIEIVALFIACFIMGKEEYYVYFVQYRQFSHIVNYVF